MIIKYKYALDENNKWVSIEKLAKEKKGMGEMYTCIECNRRLIARAILSEKMTPHFSHYDRSITSNECGGEGYLHWISKQLLAESFREYSPFYLLWDGVSQCRQENSQDHCTKQMQNRIDLLKLYPEVHVEKRDGEFIPDISLQNRFGDRIYIEIFKSSKISQEKRNSGKKIIEIKVTCEKDIEKIIAQRMIKEKSDNVEVINMDSLGELYDCQGICRYSSEIYHLNFNNYPNREDIPKDTSLHDDSVFMMQKILKRPYNDIIEDFLKSMKERYLEHQDKWELNNSWFKVSSMKRTVYRKNTRYYLFIYDFEYYGIFQWGSTYLIYTVTDDQVNMLCQTPTLEMAHDSLDIFLRERDNCF